MKKCRSVELARNAFLVFLAGVGWTLQTSQVSVMHQPCSCLIVLVATAATTATTTTAATTTTTTAAATTTTTTTTSSYPD